ncbi:anti-anti-sigma regulatory factor (antagonist of anti-sigma factor) [Singulisphaera acidiphila DSM 18658]|uniref:Anti-anti-sigma regulatory factor (Antagonist of anti-sigma factor) n=2 Tax=Singulisphaera acidiphila TaxID=466153 RepID=L0DJ04_SINAD|nr:anti-anti-sigma regulatory factor (antagonist of anti-sigma factor) [Singulisphaera acidiphila DSM 18658]
MWTAWRGSKLHGFAVAALHRVAKHPLGPALMNKPHSQDAFTIERHGDLTLISATPALESLEFGLEEQAAGMIIEQFRHQENPLVVFDLSLVDYFGSMFLALLLRCWKLVQARGGMMALAGVSTRAKELLRLTSLDMVWPIYASRQEAMEALLAD